MVGVGNTTGTEIDKFKAFALTPQPATQVGAPMIAECFANLECRLYDARLVSRYNFFIFEVVKAHAPATPKYPKTLHYTGDGVFMVSGEHLNLRRKFDPRLRSRPR